MKSTKSTESFYLG